MNTLLKKRQTPYSDKETGQGVVKLEGDRMNESKEQENLGCLCAKSKCLKLYCACFAKGKYCGRECRCKACHNFIGNKV